MSPNDMMSEDARGPARQERGAIQTFRGTDDGGASYRGGYSTSRQHSDRSADRLPGNRFRGEDRFPDRSSSGADRFANRSAHHDSASVSHASRRGDGSGTDGVGGNLGGGQRQYSGRSADRVSGNPSRDLDMLPKRSSSGVDGFADRFAYRDSVGNSHTSRRGTGGGGGGGFGGDGGRYGGGLDTSRQYFGRSADRLPGHDSREADSFPDHSSSGADRFADRSGGRSLYTSAAGSSSGARRGTTSGATLPRSRNRDDNSRERYNHPVSSLDRSSKADQSHVDRDHHRYRLTPAAATVVAGGDRVMSPPHDRGDRDRFADRSTHHDSVGVSYSSRRGSEVGRDGVGSDGCGAFERRRSDERGGERGDRRGDDPLTGREPARSREGGRTSEWERNGRDDRSDRRDDRPRDGRVSGSAKRRRSDERYGGSDGAGAAPDGDRSRMRGVVTTGGKERYDGGGGGGVADNHSDGHAYGGSRGNKRHRSDVGIGHGYKSKPIAPIAPPSSRRHDERNTSFSRSRNKGGGEREPIFRGGRAAISPRDTRRRSSSVDGKRGPALTLGRNASSSRAYEDKRLPATSWEGKVSSSPREIMNSPRRGFDDVGSAVPSSSRIGDSETRRYSTHDGSRDKQSASSGFPLDGRDVSSPIGRARDGSKLGEGGRRDVRVKVSYGEDDDGGRKGAGVEGRDIAPAAGLPKPLRQQPSEQQQQQQQQPQQQQKQQQEGEQHQQQHGRQPEEQGQQQQEQEAPHEQEQHQEGKQVDELPRHLLGQKPDFKAEGGGLGEELKFASDREEDPHRLAQRQKQIDFGKNTTGYDKYRAAVPKRKRRPEDPSTPNKNQKMSKRRWDGKIRSWRRMLHIYDTDAANTSENSGGSPRTPAMDSEHPEQEGERGDFKESGEIDFDLPCPDGPFIDPLGSSSVPLHGDLQATAARDEYQGLHEGLAKQEQEQTQDQQLLPHINAGIYTDSGDEDDGFGDSPSGDDHDGAAPGGRPWDGGDGTRTGELGKRKRGGDGGRSSPAAAGAAVAMSPWETAVDRLSGDSESEDGGASEEDDGLDDGAGRRRIKRHRERRGWGEKRSFKLGGGEQLGRGELLAAEEELEESREAEGVAEGRVDDSGRVVRGGRLKEELREGPEGTEGARGELEGAGVQEEIRGGAGGAGGAGLQGVGKEELHEMVEGEQVDKETEAGLEEGARVKEESELNEDEFSDDDLL